MAVIGQSNFESAILGTTARSLRFPFGGMAVTPDGRLFVTDVIGGVVKVFRDYEQAIGPAAEFTIPSAALSASNREHQLVLLTTNHAVHIYREAPDPDTADMAPTVTSPSGSDCAPEAMNEPLAAYVTPSGRLLVADYRNHRVLIWESIPDSGLLGEPKVVLGQEHFEICAQNDDDHDGDYGPGPTGRTLSFPAGVWSDDTRVVVADSSNSRVLIWNSFPDSFQPASLVLGQDDFFSSTVNRGQPIPSEETLAGPFGVDVSDSGQLAVVDRFNHRVLLWDSFPTMNGQPADQVIGQRDFTGRTYNDVHDEGIPQENPSAHTLRMPSGVRFQGRSLIVTDTENNRVVVWRAID